MGTRQHRIRYISLCKKLEREYENIKYNEWVKENTEKAIRLLKNMILVDKYEIKLTYKQKKLGADAEQIAKNLRKEDIERNYFVNFSPELKVIIREAQYLDKIGKPIPQTIINIALQETTYIHHVDKLEQLLREYKASVSDLKDVEKLYWNSRLKRWIFIWIKDVKIITGSLFLLKNILEIAGVRLINFEK